MSIIDIGKYKEEIIRLYVEENKSFKTIGKEIGLSHSTIHKYLKLWGIPPKKGPYERKRESEPYKEQIIDMYVNKNMSALKIAKEIGIHYSVIYISLHEWEVEIRDCKEMNGFNANKNFFEVINTEEKAYWLGFMYADGYITQDYVGIALSTEDIDHLYKFKTALNSNHNIKTYEGSTTYARLIIKSEKMKNDLIINGCVYNKSLILKFPDSRILPKELIKHFIRGYFDGDGSLVLSKGSNNFKICGTMEFLKEVINCFNTYIPEYRFNEKLYKRKKDNKNNYYISYGGRLKTYTVMRWLYENSTIYLERKYKRYLKLKQSTSSRA